LLAENKRSSGLFFAAPRSGHRILPHEINYRANIYALRSLNVRWIISVRQWAVCRKICAADVVLPSQFYDRTSQRAAHTFFGEGIGTHVGFAEPISANLRICG